MAYRRSTRRSYSGRAGRGYSRRTAGYRRASARRTVGRRTRSGARGGTIRLVIEQGAPSLAAQAVGGPAQILAQPRRRMA